MEAANLSADRSVFPLCLSASLREILSPWRHLRLDCSNHAEVVWLALEDNGRIVQVSSLDEILGENHRFKVVGLLRVERPISVLSHVPQIFCALNDNSHDSKLLAEGLSALW